MKQFLKFVLATVVGLIIFIGIIFLVLAASVNNIDFAKEKEVKLEKQTVLHLKLNYPLTDRTSEDPLYKLAGGLAGDSEVPVGLYDITKQLERAADDERVSGIFMDLSFVGAGFAKTFELRESILEFRESGKFVHAYAENMDNKTYYLASAADKVYLNPKGNIIFNGLLGSVMFYKEMLGKIGVEMQVVKRGKFKGAVEPFVFDKLSDANREQIDAYVNSLFDVMLEGISNARDISVDSLKSLANDFTVRDAEGAARYGLTDGMKFRDEVFAGIRDELGLEDDDKIHFMKLSKYIKTDKGAKVDLDNDKSGKIGIVYAEGTIVSGKGEDDQIGSDKFAAALRKLRKDDNIKAVVIRVNSPGGSAQASEVILREAELLNEQKPLIISMGDVAASGGYYISCLADSIIAQPNTITGSIGVFGLIPNAEGMFGKLGLSTDYVGTGDMSEFGRIDRALNDRERLILDEIVGKVYDDFLGHVSEGRGLTIAEVDSIGQGRVWTGTMAKERGLVDELGGLDHALEIAAYKAGLEEYRTRAYPQEKNPFEEIMKIFSMEAHVQKAMKAELGDNYTIYQRLKEVQNLDGVQAIMPYMVEFK